MGKSNNSKENEEDGSTYPLLRSGMDLSGISDVLMSSEVSATLKKVAEAAGSTSQLMAPLRATANQAMEAYLKAIPVISPELIMPSADTMRAIQKLAASLYATRIDISRYTKIDRPKSTYSAEFTSTEVYFESAERHVTSFADLNSAIADLIKHTGGLRLVWRGQADAAWGIHSGLYRRLMEINGVKNPLEKPRGEQPYPTEDQMVAAEQMILKQARTNWRFDGMSALETFARIQHEGGLTRLLDVTNNPYIAAWFAVESDDYEQKDGRIVAFATSPASSSDEPIDDSPVTLNEFWGDYEPPWHLWGDDKTRQKMDWGTGANRRIWVPPVYHDRIAAQNAAFLLDGVPITTYKVRSYLLNSENKPWNRSDILAASSVISKFLKPTRTPRANSANLAPTFTFRIASEAKKEIRNMLTSSFGYTRASIYPDMSEFAQYTRRLALPELEDIEGDE
ncbi:MULTISPECIES: FRG domain-containing protein [Actinomyces]|jgi:FRG domain protein|uniref:FRG domain-containing protein n=1 Tax=Actinomyces TaxID=1654 RepID=UPI000AB39893|nr:MULTISPECIES: FRG domain-containing protein [Actinomyces]